MMGAYLTSGLASSLQFSAGGMVAGSLKITAPAAATYYVLVEQYTSALAFIPGTRSYIYQSVVGGVAVNSTVNHTEYALAASEEEDMTMNLTLTYTDCYLYLFLKEMAGASPDPDTDDTIDFVVVALSAPTAATQIDFQQIMMLTMMIMVMGVMLPSMVESVA